MPKREFDIDDACLHSDEAYTELVGESGDQLISFLLQELSDTNVQGETPKVQCREAIRVLNRAISRVEAVKKVITSTYSC